jgi:hypothetical protein
MFLVMCLILNEVRNVFTVSNYVRQTVIFESETPDLETIGFSLNNSRRWSPTLCTRLLLGWSSTLNVKHIDNFRNYYYEDCMD